MNTSKSNLIIKLLMVSAMCLLNGDVMAQKGTKSSDAAPATQQDGESKYSEEEWQAFDDATKEPAYEKRGMMLLDFIKRWPKSELLPNVEYAFVTVLLGACDKEEKWDLLKDLAEKWFVLYPDNKETLKVIAKASEKTKDYARCAECLEELYELDPNGPHALAVLEYYTKANNLAKQIDWTDRILQMPGMEDEFGLSWDLVKKFSASDNLPKMAEWCKRTLIAAEAVKRPDDNTQEQLTETRHACHLIVGRSLYSEDKLVEAEKAYQQATKYKKSSDAYFHIGMCLWKKQDVDNAMIYLAAAEIIGENPYRENAKKGLEDLYKSQHNKNTTGIDKQYKKAKELLLNNR